ncbi:MAG TPA: STAS domain-containing protein [Burkholderiaceae bacterium]|nr:STAS domain-containing protein [Burkholderiaceae bacterium]
MVFSFFKKDQKDSKERGPKRPEDARTAPRPMGKPMPDPASRVSPARLPSQRFATTENALPDRELARSLAMETAAKIDKIESEMARDFLRPPGSGPAPAQGGTSTDRPTGSEKPAAVNGSAASAAVEDIDGSHDDFFGSVNAIEINTSGAGSVVDESAILFANGQDVAAEQVLRAGIGTDDLGHATQNAWLMLCELLNQRGDRAEFDQLTSQFAMRFNGASPSWVEYAAASETRAAAPAAAASVSSASDGTPSVRLPAGVDANVIKVLEQLKSLATTHASLRLDASNIRTIDLVGAELMLRVVTAFKRASHELVIVGAEKLIDPLRAVIEPGRRDASDAAWMLLLEILRLLGRQHEFEENGIQYCITFEVSPPQWELPPPNLKASPAVASAEPVPAPVSDGPLTWRGVIEAEGEPWFGRLAAEAKTNKELRIDASQLRRMAFSAASALLTLVMKLQQGGATVEFRNINPMVGALFQLLGITAVASVHLRRS